jgi:hypothetical protein
MGCKCMLHIRYVYRDWPRNIKIKVTWKADEDVLKEFLLLAVTWPADPNTHHLCPPAI